MKELIFDTNDKYEFIYQAMSLSELGYKGHQLRLVNRIFEKLEKIGNPKENGLGYALNTEQSDDGIYTSISLEDTEYDLVVTTFDSISWLAIGARKAAIVYDWLHSIK